MSENLKKCIQKLEFLAEIKDESLRKKILMILADDNLYKALHEIAINKIKGNIELNSTQKKKLEKFKNLFKKLSKNTKVKRERIKLIKQSGGFLPILIPAIASIIGTILSK